jgi:hypothetical protein
MFGNSLGHIRSQKKNFTRHSPPSKNALVQRMDRNDPMSLDPV